MTAGLLRLSPSSRPTPRASHSLGASGWTLLLPGRLLCFGGLLVHALPQSPLPGHRWSLPEPLSSPLPPSTLNKPSQFSVLLGAWQLENPGPRSQEVGIAWALPHPVYSWREGSRADIALVRLERSVQFSERVLPICLPDASIHLPPHTNCWIAGWGSVHDGGAFLPHRGAGGR